MAKKPLSEATLATRKETFAKQFMQHAGALVQQQARVDVPFAMPGQLYNEYYAAYERAAMQYRAASTTETAKKTDLQRANDLRKRITAMREHFEKVEKMLEEGMPDRKHKLPFTEESLQEEVSALEAEFEQVDIPEDGMKIRVLTEPILLKTKDQKIDVDFGPFWLELRRPFADNQLYATAEKPIYIPTDTAKHQTHPHVFYHKMCQGNAATNLRNTLFQGRLYDYFMLGRQVLRNVHYAGHMWPDYWIHEQCPSCGELGAAVAECVQCKTKRCKKCCKTCSHYDCAENGGHICGSCITTCRSCRKNTCKKHGFTCDYCRRRVCNDCALEKPCPSEKNITASGLCSPRSL